VRAFWARFGSRGRGAWALCQEGRAAGALHFRCANRLQSARTIKAVRPEKEGRQYATIGTAVDYAL